MDDRETGHASDVQRLVTPLGDARFAGFAAGSGPDMVLLHAGVADSRMFDGQIPGLAKQFRVTAWDRRGFGATVTPDEAFGHSDDLLRLMDSRGIGSAVLVGCSQGGRVAIDAALSAPDRVVALVLIATAIGGAPSAPTPPDIRSLEEALDRAEEADDLDAVNRIEAHMWLDGPRSVEGRVQGPARALFLEMNGIALRHTPLTARVERADAFDRIEELDMPVLLLQGELDFPHVNARGPLLAGRLRNCRTVTLPGAAHLSSLEAPDAVNAEMMGFLRTRVTR